MNNNKKIIECIVKCNKHALNGTLIVEVKTQKYDTHFCKILLKKKVYIVHHPKKTLVENGSKLYMVSCRPISPKKTHVICEEN